MLKNRMEEAHFFVLNVKNRGHISLTKSVKEERSFLLVVIYVFYSSAHLGCVEIKL